MEAVVKELKSSKEVKFDEEATGKYLLLMVCATNEAESKEDNAGKSDAKVSAVEAKLPPGIKINKILGQVPWAQLDEFGHAPREMSS